MPTKYRNAWLLIANLIFYGWGEPVYISIMVVSIAVNYLFGLWIEKKRGFARLEKTILIASVVFNLCLLGYFKYMNFFVGLMPGITIPHILLPIGISFYTFQAMSYVIDVYRKEISAQRDIITFGTYISLFSQLIAGPIIRYKDISEQLENRSENLSQVADGIRLFIVGLSKKVLLANQMGILWEFMKESPEGNGILGSWIGIIAFAFQIYFDFSGYSDMARGLGKMFGFEFRINFNYPYVSKSITEFWRRWHISLSSWFRDYVYIPMGGSRKGTARTLLNLLAVWSLTGFWHGANFNFIYWGIYYFFLLGLEKFVLSGVLKKLPGFIKHLYTLILILIGWVIFSLEDLTQMSGYLVSLFSAKHGWISINAAVQARMFLPLMVVSAFVCLPIFYQMYERFKERRGMWVAEITVVITLLLLCTASLVSQSFNPFLYFRF